MENITLYISSYNVEKTIGEVLEGVFELNPPPNEVILINDASTDQTLNILTNYQGKDRVKILNLKKNMGIGYCRNLAIKNSTNNIIATLDSDVVTDKKWLLNIYNSMIFHKSQLCGGQLIEKFLETNRYNYWRYIHLSHRFQEEKIPEVNSFLTGSNYILNKKAWEKVNGFNNQYRSNGEDVDFCIRLRLNNLKMSYDSSAYCYHLQNDTLESLKNRSWRYYVHGTGLKKPSYRRLILRTIKHLRYCLLNSAKDLLNFRLSIIDINFRIFFNYILMEYKSCKKKAIIL